MEVDLRCQKVMNDGLEQICSQGSLSVIAIERTSLKNEDLMHG